MAPPVLPHPESDLRAGISSGEVRSKASILDRIAASYAHVAGVLEHCADLRRGAAFDVGSGPGHESFALGAEFDRVIAIDTQWRAVLEARRIARAAGVRHVRFLRGDAERYTSSSPFDFVFSNVMSHNARSRVALLDRLRSLLLPGGWLFLSEATEGYAPLELHRAISHRDARELRARIRQILNGMLGRPDYRFFLAGTAEGEFERLGLEPVKRERLTWNSLVYLERSWACAARPPAPAQETAAGADRDQLTPAPELMELRGRCTDLLSARTREGFSRAQADEIREFADSAPNRVAPFLLFLLVADAVPGAWRPGPSPLDRLGRVSPALARRRDRSIDWAHLAELDATFLSLVRGRAGLEGPPED